MLVSARTVEWHCLPAVISSFAPKDQTFITPGQQYRVHAVSVFDSVTFALVVDDTDAPAFLPVALFNVVEAEIPSGWGCSFDLGGGVDLVMGPEFIFTSVESYMAMVDQDASQVDRFWAYLDNLGS